MTVQNGNIKDSHLQFHHQTWPHQFEGPQSTTCSHQYCWTSCKDHGKSATTQLGRVSEENNLKTTYYGSVHNGSTAVTSVMLNVNPPLAVEDFVSAGENASCMNAVLTPHFPVLGMQSSAMFSCERRRTHPLLGKNPRRSIS
jgi:hypothetical protein